MLLATAVLLLAVVDEATRLALAAATERLESSVQCGCSDSRLVKAGRADWPPVVVVFVFLALAAVVVATL